MPRPVLPLVVASLASLAALAALASLAACKGKPSAAESQPSSCTADSDCAEGWTCMAETCTDTSSGAIYTDPSNSVTPDKVKKEIENRAKQHQRDNARALGTE